MVSSGFPGALFSGNQSTYWLNRWQKPGDIGGLPKASTATTVYSSYGSSDVTWGDISFARLRNLSISYSLSESVLNKLKVSQIRIFFQGQNLYTWRKSKYISDPETILNINQASYVLPPLRVFTAGINVSL